MKAVDMLRADALRRALERVEALAEEAAGWSENLAGLDDEEDVEISGGIETMETIAELLDLVRETLLADNLMIERPGPRETAKALSMCEQALVEGDRLMLKGLVRAA